MDSGGDLMAREGFTTTIEKDIKIKFKQKCEELEIDMNDILEAFMTEFIDGNFKVEKKTIVQINQRK